MSSRAERANGALAIMRRWYWKWTDPDGMFETDTMELRDVVNRLAMEGLSRPEYALLPLLCDGRLRAQATYHWRKYEAGQRYQMEGYFGDVPIKRWQQLVDFIDWEARELAADGFPLVPAVLEKLELGECEPYELNVHDNRFNLAICEPDSDWRTPGYVEEWYSAHDIVLSLPATPVEPISELAEPVVSVGSKGGAPRKWDWEGALLHLAALAHFSPDGLLREGGEEPNQSDIAARLRDWFVETRGLEPADSQLRSYGKRFLTELNALRLKAANNPDRPT